MRLLEAQELIVLRQPIRAIERTGLDLAAISSGMTAPLAVARRNHEYDENWKPPSQCGRLTKPGLIRQSCAAEHGETCG